MFLSILSKAKWCPEHSRERDGSGQVLLFEVISLIMQHRLQNGDIVRGSCSHSNPRG